MSDALVVNLLSLSRTALRAVTHISLAWQVRLLLASTVCLALSVLSPWVDRASTTELVIYTGKVGGNVNIVAGELAGKLRSHKNAFGREYRVRVEELSNLSEITQRVEANSTGTAIGFAQDLHNPKSGLRALAPLELSCLHLIVGPRILAAKDSRYARLIDREKSGRPTYRTGYRPSDAVEGVHHDDPPPVADNVAISSQKNEAIQKRHALQLDEIVGHLMTARVYLGPYASETRRIAEEVIEKSGVQHAPCGRLAAHGIHDWIEMRAALNAQSIDAAFFMGPLPSSVVEDIASDGNCQLVDLREVVEAVHTGNGALKEFRIDPHVYPAGRSDREGSVALCDGVITTIATRNLIVCTEGMSDYDAFQVTKAADEVGIVSGKIWEQVDPDGRRVAPQMLSHAGAEVFKSHPNSEPPRAEAFDKVSAFAWASLLPIGFALLAQCAEWANRWMENQQRNRRANGKR